MLIAYFGILALVYQQQTNMLFPAPQVRSKLPNINGLVETKLTTPDQEILPGWYIAPQGLNPTILFFHGNGDQINSFSFLAAQFSAQGFGFAAFEYRGYPGATGTISELGIMTDGLAAFDWVKNNCQCNIVLLSHSMGTGVAINVAAEREASAVALLAGYSSIADIAAARFWFLPVRFLIKNPIHSDKRISKVTEPILMMHGLADNVIPIQFGRKLFAIANEPKQFIPLQGVGHNEILSQGIIADVLTWVGK